MVNIHQYKDMTTSELDKMGRESTLFIFPVSLLEEHGNHLPLGVDIYVAEYMADRLAARIPEKFGFHNIVILPALNMGVGGIPMTGTIESDYDTTVQVIFEYGRSLARSGFKYCLISNGHAGSRHLSALETVKTRLMNELQFEMIPAGNRVTEMFFSGELLEEIIKRLPEHLSSMAVKYFSKDGHAGWWETSMMLLIKPELVQDNFKELPYSEEIGKAGYKGYPAFADSGFAQITVDVILDYTIMHLEEYFLKIN
ncbi:MAG: creatininase family protein [Calditrichaceae bacterium]